MRIGKFKIGEFMSKYIDLTGEKFGRLTAIRRVENAKNGQTRFLCRCDCGNYRTVVAVQLRSGQTQSCGCMRKDLLTTHNATNTRLYSVWWGIKSRCYSPKCRGYENYGGRGITICDEWLGKDGFQHFRDWAYANGYDENAPRGECTIDRIDNDKGYSPDNCRWVDMKFQGNHRRNNREITYNGETHTASEWAKKIGISVETIFSRLDRNWSVTEALNGREAQEE